MDSDEENKDPNIKSEILKELKANSSKVENLYKIYISSKMPKGEDREEPKDFLKDLRFII